jgi:hypothetical protein
MKPHEIGREFEEAWSKRVGGKLVPGSGNKWWAKMDVGDAEFLWSCKATTNNGFRITQELVDEVVEAVFAPGGRGSSTPALALRVGTPAYDLVVLRADDFERIVQQEVKYVRQSNEDSKRQRAAVPELLRDD